MKSKDLTVFSKAADPAAKLPPAAIKYAREKLQKLRSYDEFKAAFEDIQVFGSNQSGDMAREIYVSILPPIPIYGAGSSSGARPSLPLLGWIGAGDFRFDEIISRYLNLMCNELRIEITSTCNTPIQGVPPRP